MQIFDCISLKEVKETVSDMTIIYGEDLIVVKLDEHHYKVIAGPSEGNNESLSDILLT